MGDNGVKNMSKISLYFRLIPLLIKAAEIALGAKKGELKKQMVIDEFFGIVSVICAFAGLDAGVIDNAAIRALVGEAIDGIVALLNATGVLKKSA